MLPFLYAALLIWQITWLVSAIRKHRSWIRLLVLNVLSTVLAIGLMWYFDTLPGYGMMPGFAYFPEVLYSLVSAIVFAVLTLISLLGMLFHRKK